MHFDRSLRGRPRASWWVALAGALLLPSGAGSGGCGDNPAPVSHPDLGTSAMPDLQMPDLMPRPPRMPGDCDGPCPASKINHLVIVVQENHTFDAYFARYCTAAAGSSPTCATGPACCEAGPAKEPGGASPLDLDDAANAGFDPDHHQSCELDEIDGGKMDHFVTGLCGDPKNFAYAPPPVIKPYWDLAAANALADHYFQPIAGQSSSNDMYFARAGFVFADNTAVPDAIGKECALGGPKMGMSFPGMTIGDLLVTKGVSWAWYAQGYQAMVDARKAGGCPPADPMCGVKLASYPCVYDPTDSPFQYFASFTDNPKYMRDYGAFAKDLAGDQLPQVTFIKSQGFRSEHPGYHTTIKSGVDFVGSVLDLVRTSHYAPDTLVLLTYDEGGGYFDHVAPPPPSTADKQPYGTRVPLLAIGPFARKNAVSHVVMEHSSIVKFVEWNWLDKKTGQLGTRDAVVNNLGSLLDPAATGTPVPEQQ